MSIPKLNKENELSNVTQPAGGQVGIQTQVFLTPNLQGFVAVLPVDQKNKKDEEEERKWYSTCGSLSGGTWVCSEG